MRYINFLIKPASSLCNLRCRYCFYEDEAENRTQKSMGVMTQATVDTLLADAYASVDEGGGVNFAFQGGEPTVAGLDYFKQFVAKARAQCPRRVQLSFAIQTNGTLLDEDWAKFLHEENFLVGLSIDGFKDLHNLHRVDAEGKDTWNRVTRTLTLLKKHRVAVNALCVVTGQCARSPEKAYEQLKKLGFDFIQFIACLDPIGMEKGCMPWSLTPEAYGKFLCRVFDLWYADWEKGQYHSVRLFDDYVHVLLGDGASTCATCGRCGAYFVVEGDGSVYPCDFFVLDKWKMGMLGQDKLADMAKGDVSLRFLQWGMQKPAECAACPWGRVCSGGCKNDWVEGEDGPHNHYCAAFRTLLDYAGQRLMNIARAEREAARRAGMR